MDDFEVERLLHDVWHILAGKTTLVPIYDPVSHMRLNSEQLIRPPASPPR